MGRRRQLERGRKDPAVDFIVVLMHQCAFSSSSKHGSDAGVQQAWFDLFAKHQVDLVLQGHDHTYERTHAMEGDTVVDGAAPYRTDTGTVYVVCGNGGATQEPFKPAQPEWSAFRKEGVIGTLRVDVDPFGPGGTCRLTLGEYAAATGRPIEKGIVLERAQRHPRTKQPAVPAAVAAQSAVAPMSVAAQQRAPRLPLHRHLVRVGRHRHRRRRNGVARLAGLARDHHRRRDRGRLGGVPRSLRRARMESGRSSDPRPSSRGPSGCSRWVSR